MGIDSLKELYFEELRTLYDAETQMIRTLPRLAESARDPELREVLTKHCERSRLHLERLQLIFTHWGQPARSQSCPGVAGIVQEADARLNRPATPEARDAAIIGIAQLFEHYEIAAYGCARNHARRLNRPDEARLLQETLAEEGRTDHRLTEIADTQADVDTQWEAEIPNDTRAATERSDEWTDRSGDAADRLPDRAPMDRERMVARQSERAQPVSEHDSPTSPSGDKLQ
jgi:ferritin-like metal-binding protein YciE